MKEVIAALVKSQAEIKNAAKDAKNPHFKNNYATLESVIDATKEIANKNGLAIVQVSGRDDQGDYVETVLYHESGSKIDSKCYLVLDKQNMQGLGSAITYARRYSLAAIFCITQQDDDGNAASTPRYSAPPQKESFSQTMKREAEIEMPTPEIEKRVGPDYRFPSGKFVGLQIRDVDKNQLENYRNWFEKQPSIAPKQKELLHFISQYLDNYEIYREDA